MANEYLKNELWVHRMQEAFTLLDVNKNGYLELEDFEISTRNLQREAKAGDALVDNLRKAVHEFCAGFGLKKGMKLTKDEWLPKFSAFVVSECARKQRGEEPLLFKVNNAEFDIVDTNRDGFVTLEEYRVLVKAWNYDPDTADETFKLMDTNKNNKLERAELNEYDFKFWYGLDDPETKGMYGEAYELSKK